MGNIVPGTRAAAQFGTFGRGSSLGFPWEGIFGESAIHVGENTLIGRHSTMSVGYGPTQSNLPTRGLVIGDRCVVGARACFTAHSSIEIGDDVWFGKDVFISDSGHGYEDPVTPIGNQLAPHVPVSIGAGSWIGHGAIILPGTTIGRHVVVAAGSVVRGVVPDHTVVAGVPAKAVKRYDETQGWTRVDGREVPTIAAVR